MDAIAEQPRRGRPPRAETGMAERRRERRFPKRESAEGPVLKLDIPTWVKEKYPSTEFEYRWFRGDAGRMMTAHRGEWDPVEGVDDVPATDKDGRPANHILHVKRKDWYDEDRAHLEANRVELEKQMARGVVKAKGDDSGETLSEQVSYADESNRLR